MASYQQTHSGIKSAVLLTGTKRGDPCLPPSNLSGGGFFRREDLLKPDVVSEVILVGAGALVFVILILSLVIVLTQASAPV